MVGMTAFTDDEIEERGSIWGQDIFPENIEERLTKKDRALRQIRMRLEHPGTVSNADRMQALEIVLAALEA